MTICELPAELLSRVRGGVVIPAMPLALDANRRLDPRRQRALVRYYLDAGSGGLAVGVHTTQFEIRNPGVDLFEPVLGLAARTMDEWVAAGGRPVLKIAGICGGTAQALREAQFAVGAGYHAGMVSLAALKTASVPELVAHCRAVAEVLPIIGFYLQPAVGGRLLPFDFWRQFAAIPNVLAIKIAPFNRYQTLDVVRGVCAAGRENEVALYTGNDDNIVLDLLTTCRIRHEHGESRVRIVGGLLGHWACWTRRAVELVEQCHALVASGAPIPQEMLTRAIEVTDSNAAFFDTANQFKGCIAGIHEVLRRQGLLEGTWCLNPHETLSPGQAEEISRVYRDYPHLHDDDFVRANLARWLAE